MAKLELQTATQPASGSAPVDNANRRTRRARAAFARKRPQIAHALGWRPDDPRLSALILQLADLLPVEFERLLTEEEVAEILRWEKKALQRRRWLGLGPRFIRVGKRSIRYPESALWEFIQGDRDNDARAAR